MQSETLQNKIQGFLEATKSALNKINYNLKEFDDEKTDEPVRNQLATQTIPANYQTLFAQAAQALVPLQEFHCLTELITEKTIALKHNLDIQHEFLKNYSEKLNTLTKTDSSTYIKDRKKALEESLANRKT